MDAVIAVGAPGADHSAAAKTVRSQPGKDGARSKIERWFIPMAGMLRIAYVGGNLPAVLAGTADGYRYPLVVVGGFVGWAVWSGVLVRRGLSRNGLTRGWVIADVAIIAALEPAVAWSVPGGYTNWQNWTVGPAIGAPILAVEYTRWRTATSLTALVILGYLIGAGYELTTMDTRMDAPMMVNGVGAIVLFALLVAGIVRLLRRMARQVDEATAAAVAATSREVAIQARFDERTEQYKMLHDTVLHTLSKIARGGLDHRTAEVQALCDRDATYLRGLITGSDKDVPTSLAAELAEVVRDRAALGLQIHSQFHGLPPALPQRVVDAFVNAIREALNNVSTHSGTSEAWLTAIGYSEGGLRASVVDRGKGFDPATTPPGVGLTRSIRHRIEEIRGEVTVDSSLGDGTVVELTWTP